MIFAAEKNYPRALCKFTIKLTLAVSCASLANAGLAAQAAVTTSHPRATEAALRVLRDGGNAFDAAAAAQLALNVVEPQSSGIGGGFFMLAYLAGEHKTIALDAREQAPMSASVDMFKGMKFDGASTSGISVGVPGTLAGLDYIVRKWGKLPLANSVQPAIQLAQHGFPVGDYLAKSSTHSRAEANEAIRRLFRSQDGGPLIAGSWLVQSELANTLKLIASKGIEVFYRGEIAQAILKAQQQSTVGEAGTGRLQASDLQSYQVFERAPLEGKYRGYGVASMPTPSSGGLSLLMLLGLMEAYPLGDAKAGYEFASVDSLNLMAEAMRGVFADRSVWMGDEKFVALPGQALLSECHIKRRQALIRVGLRGIDIGPLDPLMCHNVNADVALLDSGGGLGENTTHFTIADQFGNVVSITSTVEYIFGSTIVVPGYGFVLNNELTDFNFEPQAGKDSLPGANDVAPGKRPRSSMAPTMLFKNGKFFAAYGSPGGSTIINTVFNITLNLIDHKMTGQQAIDAPRWSVTHWQGKIACEASPPSGASFAAATTTRLREMGYVFAAGDAVCGDDIGSVQLLEQIDGRYFAFADQRRDGSAVVIPME